MTLREDLSMQLSGLFYPGDQPNFHREADMLLESGPVARLVEHSVTLNAICYRMAEALGLTNGTDSIEYDPNELVVRLIAQHDAEWEGITVRGLPTSPDTCKESAPDLTRPGDVPKRLPHV